MAPKSPWNKKPTNENTQKVTKENLPHSTAPAVINSSTINYGEVQAEEIEVLEAIYSEDFHLVETKSAWSKTVDRGFSITLRSLSDQDSYVIFSVKLTATYPRTVPLLDVHDLEKFHERTQKRVRNILVQRPKQLLGEVMIHSIASEIQDAIEDAVVARQQATLPSLEDERASAEETAYALAKEVEEAEARQAREAQEEEDRMLKQMVDDEIVRREKRKPVKVAESYPEDSLRNNSSQIISFDQPAKVQIGTEFVPFKQISITGLLFEDSTEHVYIGSPQTLVGSGSALVAVRRTTLSKERQDVIELEKVLESVCQLYHPNLINVLAFRIDRIDNLTSELVLCHEYAGNESLHDLLSLSSLHTGVARQFATSLLEGLDYLHHHGIAHGAIGTRSIYVNSRSPVTAKLADFGYASTAKQQDDGVPSQWRSPEGNDASPTSLRKSDIWYIGVVFVQMFCGTSTLTEFASPSILLIKLDFSEAFEDLLNKMFSNDPRKRLPAFNLLPVEFLRTESPVFDSTSSKFSTDSSKPGTRLLMAEKRRSRHNSSNVAVLMSRYAQDFTELQRLGKGGFGEVVKVRNKLDGGLYAVKKIRQAPQLLDQVLSEVMLLNRLNHPYVVRYFSTWVENDTGAIVSEAFSSTEEATSDRNGIEFETPSLGGLDFVSSSGYHGFEFAVDDDEDSDSDDGNTDSDGSSVPEPKGNNGIADSTTKFAGTPPSKRRPELAQLGLRKSRSDSHYLQSTLYIQMEYCDRRSLHSEIHKGVTDDDAWRYVRQITEGLAHIHSHGIIHRDLKPDNVFIDIAGNPKIGDFGLATKTHYHHSEIPTGSKSHASGDMTRSVGTALYVAPELRSASNVSYNDRVDMYSLGIICIELWQHFGTGMERINELQQIRKKDHVLPQEFLSNGGAKAEQGKIIDRLISHKPSERPSSTELLRMLPVKIEDETIRQALSGLSDQRSPYHQKMMSALFAHDTYDMQRVKAEVWEAHAPTSSEDVSRIRLKAIVRQSLESVFRRHGAEEVRRESIFPRSAYYSNSNVVQLLDASGNLLQLPYDLTLPYARSLSRQVSSVRCSFTFGCAYRDVFTGGPPKINEEADFDIINQFNTTDASLNDAEVMKVMDEAVVELVTLGRLENVSFRLNHSEILDAILDICRVPKNQQPAVKETLSKLGFLRWTWPKVRSELRNIGLSDTSLDDLHEFDFREPPTKAIARLRTFMESVDSRFKLKMSHGIELIRQILSNIDQFDIVQKILISPLSCFNAKFYSGVLFQCVIERKDNHIVIAAGGRYDSLIQRHQGTGDRLAKQGAVGICIGIEPIVDHLCRSSTANSKKQFLKDERSNASLPKRCDVLVVAKGSENLRNLGIKILTTLWNSEISAELAGSGWTAHEYEYAFIVSMRHEASNTVRLTNTESNAEGTEVTIASLTSYVQQELRDRGNKKTRRSTLRTDSSHHESDRKNNVNVLLARHGSKKSNKYYVVEAAQQKWSEKLEQMKSAPILAIEGRDEILGLIQETRLSDGESWRKAVQSVQLNERQYVANIQETLESWRSRWAAGDGLRDACVFNFRTESSIYYDLGS